MKQNFKISDIRRVLDSIEKLYPERKIINFKELGQRIKEFRKPVIYNMDDLIRLLSEYIIKNQKLEQMYKEKEVCNILKVRKLTMHQWRKHGYISFYKGLYVRTIRYNLPQLLEDIKNIHDKNISPEYNYVSYINNTNS